MPNIKGELTTESFQMGFSPEDDSFFGAFRKGERKSRRPDGWGSTCYGGGFDASRTFEKNGSTDPKKWSTINNTAYKDPVKQSDGSWKPIEVASKNITQKLWFRKF